MTEDETVGWHHRLSGHKFEQVLGDDEGQGSACCSPSCGKKSEMTERLNNKTFSKHLVGTTPLAACLTSHSVKRDQEGNRKETAVILCYCEEG